MLATTSDAIRSHDTCGPSAWWATAVAKRLRTTKSDPTAARHPDLVRRDFTATAPNQPWVTDMTFAPIGPVWPTSASAPTSMAE